MAKMKESVKDVALDEMLASTAKDANEQANAKTLEKHEQLCELSRALAVLASASVCRLKPPSHLSYHHGFQN